MTFDFRLCTRALAAVAMVSLIAACSSDLTGSNRRLVQLSFATNATAEPAANLVTGDPVVGALDKVTLTSAELVFGKIELDRSGTVDCIEDEDDNGDYGDDYGDGRRADDDDFGNDGDDDGDKGRGHDDDDCEEVLSEPILVTLPLVDGQVSRVIEIPLPDGAFSELEARLQPDNADEPLLAGKSVRVVGTFRKKNMDETFTDVSFVFTSRVRAKLEMDLNPPLNDGTTNATVSIDVRSWFLNSFGRVIDPRDPNNRRRIERNIRRSFRAFEDNDRHGDDDHRDGRG